MKKKYDMNYSFNDDRHGGYTIKSCDKERPPYDFYAYMGLAALFAPAARLVIGAPAGMWLSLMGLTHGSPLLLDSVDIILYIISGIIYALHITGITVGIIGTRRKAYYAKRCLIFSITGCLYYSLTLAFLLSVQV